MLEILGYQVTTIISGKEALSLYAEQPDQFDMVILDMIMTVMGAPRHLNSLSHRHHSSIDTGYCFPYIHLFRYLNTKPTR